MTHEPVRLRHWTALRVIQVVVSAGLLAFLLSRIDPDTIALARTLGPGVLLAGAGLAVTSQVWCGVRLWTLLRRHAVPVRLPRVIVLTFVGVFFNNFSPATVGGDVVKGFFLFREQPDRTLSVLALLFDRVANLAVLVTLTAACVAATGMWRRVGFLGTGPALSVAVTAAAVAVLVLLWLIVGRRLMEALPLQRLRRTLSESRDILGSWVASPRTVTALVLLSLLALLSSVIGGWLVLRALGAGTTLVEFTGVVGLVTLVGMVPISFNGLGLHEVGFVLLLPAVGATSQMAVTVAVIVRLFSVGNSVIGGLLLAMPGRLAQGRRGVTDHDGASLSPRNPDHGPGHAVPEDRVLD